MPLKWWFLGLSEASRRTTKVSRPVLFDLSTRDDLSEDDQLFNLLSIINSAFLFGRQLQISMSACSIFDRHLLRKAGAGATYSTGAWKTSINTV